MSTIFREKGYRFFFYAADLDEPIHVHITKSSQQAKFWIVPIRASASGGFKEHELNEIESIIRARINEINQVWNREKNKRDNLQG
ncbi:MAG: DUF4160 domain-containing protein [Chloroflexota bacterium]|nr:DUF4160 domain-containing protein [Chloroflexota bacterium]